MFGDQPEIEKTHENNSLKCHFVLTLYCYLSVGRRHAFSPTNEYLHCISKINKEVQNVKSLARVQTY